MRYSSPPVDTPRNVNMASSYNPGPTAFSQAPGPTGYQSEFAGWPGMNDATAQMGVQFGKSAVAAGQDYVEKNVRRLRTS
jgi:hypothetical protein